MRRAADGSGFEAGFTLFEMICVVAILAMAAVLVVGYKPPWSGGLQVRTGAAELASALRLTRSEAIARNRPSAVELDLDTRRYRDANGATHQLPARLNLVLLTIAGERRSERVGAIRFNPDGSSSGGRISINDGTHAIDVGVDWLSGRVTTADAR